MYRAVGVEGARATASRLTMKRAVAAAGRAARSIVVEGGVVSIDGHDVTREIRTPEMDKAAAAVARLPRVREVLVARQRDEGERGRRRDGGARHRDGRVSGTPT